MALILDGLDLRAGSFSLAASLEVTQGRKVAVMGPSGAGKSTLIAAIAGFLVPQAGRILWDGADITAMAPGARPVSTLFQDGNLFPHLQAAQNVALGLRPDLKLTAEQWAHVDQALEQVGLKGYGDRKPAALSGGQQSRVALARVLVQDRPLLLLDEPFAALGPALKVGMLELVSALVRRTGKTLLMVSHDPADARRIADEVVVVADGAASAPQNTQAVLDDPPPALRDYLGT